MALSADDLDKAGRLAAVVDEAGGIAMRFFKPGRRTGARIDWKGDGSPVTEADLTVNAFLEGRVRALWPEAAWLSEESADDPARLACPRVIVVDPIDGTRGFAEGEGTWCVAVALVEAGRPIAAVVHAPARGETYTACAGHGTRRNGRPIQLPQHHALEPGMRVSSSSAMAKLLAGAGIPFDYRPKISSLALRIANVASGAYHCCLAGKNANDWDLAAADLVLQEAGGRLSGYDGRPLLYNRADTRHAALAAAAAGLQTLMIEAITRGGQGRQP